MKEYLPEISRRSEYNDTIKNVREIEAAAIAYYNQTETWQPRRCQCTM